MEMVKDIDVLWDVVFVIYIYIYVISMDTW